MIVRGSTQAHKFIATINEWDPNREEISITGDTSAFLGYKVPTKGGDGGVWATWQWEDQHFEFRNDAYGFYPIYYFHNQRTFGISTSILDLLQAGAPNVLDDRALAVYLRFGLFMADDTPFKEIRMVPPHCRIRWSAEGINVESLATGNNGDCSSLSRPQAIQQYGELFQVATERLQPEPNDKVILPLSGGRDSRHILYALVRAGHRAERCVTVQYPPPHSKKDVATAANIATALGIPHTIIQQRDSYIQSERRKNLLTSFCAAEHAWILCMADYLKETCATQIYDGIAGDVLSAGLFLNAKRLELYQNDRLEELAEDILGSEGYLASMLTSEACQRWNRSLALQHIHTELRKYTQKANPIGQFYFWNRTRREIALSPWSVLTNACQVFAPFLDVELYEFLTALPASYFLDHQFHTETIEEFYPEFGAIVTVVYPLIVYDYLLPLQTLVFDLTCT